MSRLVLSSWTAVLAGAVTLCGVGFTWSCAPSDAPQTGSQTNWMRTCEKQAECGDLACICGSCSQTCGEDSECSALGQGSCLAASDERAAFCGAALGKGAGLCVPSCDPGSCPDETVCDQGACVPAASAASFVEVDLTSRYQALVGFGSSLSYGEDEIVAHPAKEKLLDAMFTDLGTDVVRMGNRYRANNPKLLASAGEIIAAAQSRIGENLTLVMTLGSPPPELKANGATNCTGDPAGCTLARGSDGSFDYGGFADHWRAALEGYAAEGVVPDYVGIQNDPDWLPPADNGNDACVLLPEEGSTKVTVDGASQTVEFAGYREALEAVANRLSDLPSRPKFLGPEASSLEAIEPYLPIVNSGALSALACHLYESDPSDPDLTPYEDLKEQGESTGLPIFQTEMNTDGLSTAVLMHRVLTAGNAQMYLQNDFTSAAAGNGNLSALIQLASDTFELQGPYHAIRHYAYRTDPGWVRVEASSPNKSLLVSAWLSPGEDALTLVAVNPEIDDLFVSLGLEEQVTNFASTEIVQTSFDDEQKFEEIGDVPSSLHLVLPGHSVTTIALWN